MILEVEAVKWKISKQSIKQDEFVGVKNVVYSVAVSTTTT